MIKVTPNYNPNYQYYPQKKNSNISFGLNPIRRDSVSFTSREENIKDPAAGFLKFLNSVQNGAKLKNEEYDDKYPDNTEDLKPMFGELPEEIISGGVFKYTVLCDATRHDVRDYAEKSKVFSSLSVDKQKQYLDEMFALCNMKNSSGDFVISNKFSSDDYSRVFSDFDAELITDILDIKYAIPYNAEITNYVLGEFIEGNIEKTELKKIVYMISNGLQDLPKELRHKPEEFFIDIPGYGKNYEWAQYMSHSASLAALKIFNKETFEDVMESIADDLSKWDLNHVKNDDDAQKAIQTGRLRDDSSKSSCSMSYFGMSDYKYSSYGNRFAQCTSSADDNDTVRNYQVKVPEELSEFEPTRICFYPESKKGKLIHNRKKLIQTLGYCEKIYNNLINSYTSDKFDKNDIKEINKQIAVLHWLLSHSMPYMRGSDAILNTFIKALYSALGFQLAPPKKGISFDLEAFCTELDDYIEKYPSLYQNPPKYVL